jgi:hypothetical protein
VELDVIQYVPEQGRSILAIRKGKGQPRETNDLRTLLLKAAYPPFVILAPGRTSVRIRPQNLPVAGFMIPAFVLGVSSSSKCTLEWPPLSASHPILNCVRSSLVLKVKSVRGSREGSSAPSMRITGKGYQHPRQDFESLKPLFPAWLRIRLPVLFQYCPHCDIVASDKRARTPRPGRVACPRSTPLPATLTGYLCLELSF